MSKSANIDTTIFNNINVGIYRNTPGPHGRFIKANDTLMRLHGFTNMKNFLKVPVVRWYANPEERKAVSDTLLKMGFIRRKEILLRRKDGSVFNGQVTAVAVKDPKGRIKWFDGIVEDVTEAKLEQERFKLIYENSPVAIWEEDFSSFIQLYKKLQQLGVTDLKRYLSQHPKYIVEAFRKIRILDVNKAGLTLYGARTKQELINHFGEAFAKGIKEVLIEEFLALARGDKFFETEIKSRTLSGKLYDVLLRVSVPDGYEKTLSRVIVTLQNITDRKDLERHLKKIAQEDGLTKLLNSRTISKRLEEELIRARRYNLDLSCLMLDVDRFKRINDRYGHQRGDQVLKRVAVLIKKSVRRSDVVGRYGGDEFFVILTQTKKENAQIAAQRIRQLVSDLNFHFSRKENLKVAISIGVSGYPAKGVDDFMDLITKADNALYAAKRAGRDCVMMA